jgi:hypothetical protein
MAEILYAFEQNREALGFVNNALGGIDNLKQQIANLFKALELGYSSTGGATALQEAHQRFNVMLTDALTVSDDIQRKASTQQDVMQALDRTHAGRFA